MSAVCQALLTQGMTVKRGKEILPSSGHVLKLKETNIFLKILKTKPCESLNSRSQPSMGCTLVNAAGVWGHPWLHIEFKVSLGYLKLCLNNNRYC